MGNKANPTGLRVSVNKNWDSRWFAHKGYSDFLLQDLKIRQFLRKKLGAEGGQAGLSKIIIERLAKKVRITIACSRPGIVIGKKGADIDKFRPELSKIAGCEVALNITEIRRPELDAYLVASGIAQQLERRASFRRVMKKAMQAALRLGAKGVKVNCSGRLNGIEIARTEEYREGRIPLHTLRADIDYAEATAKTTYGTCGVKVWIYKGNFFETAATV